MKFIPISQNSTAMPQIGLLSRIRQVTEIFENLPLLGREGGVEETREFAISGLPYTVVYRIISASDLDILTIVHQRKLYPPQS